MKQPYEKPKVRRHGDLASLTKGPQGGTGADGAAQYRYPPGGGGGGSDPFS
jgi:hypothetical protein